MGPIFEHHGGHSVIAARTVEYPVNELHMMCQSPVIKPESFA